MDSRFEIAFPNLHDIATKKTSDCDCTYNCIAWAFKDSRNHWWPNSKRSYWPIKKTLQTTAIGAFEEWFLVDGWEETSSHEAEYGYEKVALFALDGTPTHAARLLDRGVWTSKLGASIDLSHDFAELDGPKYGRVFKIYRKPLS